MPGAGRADTPADGVGVALKVSAASRNRGLAASRPRDSAATLLRGGRRQNPHHPLGKFNLHPDNLFRMGRIARGLKSNAIFAMNILASAVPSRPVPPPAWQSGSTWAARLATPPLASAIALG